MRATNKVKKEGKKTQFEVQIRLAYSMTYLN
jgi:hypothetical protein